MKKYKVKYQGYNSRFRNLERLVQAETERDAVEKVFNMVMPDNYWPTDDGRILDCDGYELASATDSVILYDGGTFKAKEL
jgi:hypothetical protein